MSNGKALKTLCHPKFSPSHLKFMFRRRWCRHWKMRASCEFLRVPVRYFSPIPFLRLFFLSSPFLHLIRFTYTIFWMCPFLVSEFSGCISNILWRRKHWMACCAYIQRIFKCGRHEKPSFRKKDEQKSDRKRNIETLNIRILFLFYFTPLFISYTLFMCHETIRMVPIILKNITK